jgi:hypothetical protein
MLSKGSNGKFFVVNSTPKLINPFLRGFFVTKNLFFYLVENCTPCNALFYQSKYFHTQLHTIDFHLLKFHWQKSLSKFIFRGSIVCFNFHQRVVKWAKPNLLMNWNLNCISLFLIGGARFSSHFKWGCEWCLFDIRLDNSDFFFFRCKQKKRIEIKVNTFECSLLAQRKSIRACLIHNETKKQSFSNQS